MHITYKQPQLVEVSAALHNGTSDYHSVVLGRRTPVQGHDRETVSELGDRPVLNITKKPDNTSELVTKNIGLLNCGVKTRQRLIVQDLLPSVLCYLLALSSALGILSTASCLLFIPALPITRQYFQFGDFQPLCSHHHVTGKQQTELQDLK
ncbi:uncharacterized protein LOC119187756 isoform X2 [Rhipicephalus microplus]|uniref:uncharacterized protein LOC119187756 isoform X2 n=1 Tax=Rhipicephalus microplus TaxID=6941 RepID=UPI003F6AA4D8